MSGGASASARCVIGHRSHPFPRGQVDVQVGEELQVLERYESGWWEVRPSARRHNEATAMGSACVYLSVCLSVGLSVCRSAGRSVGLSV